MIIEAFFEGNPTKIIWNKKHAIDELLNMFTPPLESERYIAVDENGTILVRHKKAGEQVSDGQRVYISRRAGTAA